MLECQILKSSIICSVTPSFGISLIHRVRAQSNLRCSQSIQPASAIDDDLHSTGIARATTKNKKKPNGNKIVKEDDKVHKTRCWTDADQKRWKFFAYIFFLFVQPSSRIISFSILFYIIISIMICDCILQTSKLGRPRAPADWYKLW